MSCCDPTIQSKKMETPKPNKLIAAIALVDQDNRVLIAKRPSGKDMAGLWEFPGGKIEENEAPQIALKREAKEELGIDICTGCQLPLAFTSYSYDDFNIVLLLFICRTWEGAPSGIEGQELKWVRPNELTKYEMPEANAVLISAIRDSL